MIILAGLLAGLAAVSIFGITLNQNKNNQNKKIEIKNQKETLEIFSNEIPFIEPHLHTVGDSIYDLDHHVWVGSEPFTIDQDVWIIGIKFKVNNASKSILHHASLTVPAQKNEVCPGAAWGQEWFIAGQDSLHQDLTFPEGYAMFVPRGTTFQFSAMIHNPLPPYGPGEVYKNANVSVVLDLEKDSQKVDKTPVKQLSLHLADKPCPERDFEFAFTVPPNSENFVKIGQEVNGLDPSKLIFEKSTKIIYSLGHIHAWEGGQELNVLKNGEEILSFTPFQEDEANRPWLWRTRQFPDKVMNFNPGDELSIQAVYSNPGHLPLRGVMGIYSFFLVEE